MYRYLLICAAVIFAALQLSCGGSNNPPAATGTVSGKVTMSGPFNGAVDLQVGIFNPGTNEPFQVASAGHITSAATAALSGREITFSFTEIDPGTYTVRVFAAGATPTYYYISAPFTTSSSSPNKDLGTETASMSGEGPFGTISGIVTLQGNTTFPDAATYVTFIGFSPMAEPQNVLQWVVTSDDVQSSGHLVFNVDGLAYGTWLVGLYVYNPVTHDFSTAGAFDSPVTISADNPYEQGVVFPADFDGDPGTDPALGVITGTVTFNGDLPSGQFITISANTIPPQQGAPPASFDVAPGDLDANHQVHFTLPLLLNDEYSVSIYSYDFATHQATYFGQYNGTVTIDDAHLDVSGIDFDADVTIIN